MDLVSVIKRLYIILIGVGLASAVILAFAYPLIFPNTENFDIDLKFNKTNAYNFIEDQLDLGNRIPGTQERLNCANYFVDKFEEIDAGFTYILHNFTVDYGTPYSCQNVLFKINEEETKIVILGAHYDSRAQATQDPSPAKRTDPVPGANDGASGCGVLLELASVFYDCKNKLECQIWFLFFDAEDQGNDGGGDGISDWEFIEGSKEFADNIDDFYDKNKEDFECMILLDMVGGINLQFISEQHSTSSLLGELFETGRNLGYTDEFPLVPTSKLVTDDHVPFNPICPTADLVINFWDNPDWPYWHTTEDDISNIRTSSLEVTGETVEQFIYNNYHVDSDYEKKDWNEDVNLPDSEIIYLLILISIISAGIIVIYLIRHSNIKKLRKEYLKESQEKDQS